MKKLEIECENSIFIKPNFWLQFLSRAFVLVASIIAVFIIGFSFTYDNALVYGVSMQPTLNGNSSSDKDQVYINKFSNFSYGDIIVLKKSVAIDLKHIIKRVIALPGDVIEIKQDVQDNNIYVYRNGKKLIENYIYNINTSGDPENRGMFTTLDNFIKLRNYSNSHTDTSAAVFDSNGRLVVQKGQVFLLGDNRGYSSDSSSEGPFNISDVVGRVDFIVPNGIAPFYYFLDFFVGIRLFKQS